jgi:hypothetical protein
MVEEPPTQSGKEKVALISEDIVVKRSLPKSREKIVREMAGWLTHKEAEELRRATRVFSQINRR